MNEYITTQSIRATETIRRDCISFLFFSPSSSSRVSPFPNISETLSFCFVFLLAPLSKDWRSIIIDRREDGRPSSSITTNHSGFFSTHALACPAARSPIPHRHTMQMSFNRSDTTIWGKMIASVLIICLPTGRTSQEKTWQNPIQAAESFLPVPAPVRLLIFNEFSRDGQFSFCFRFDLIFFRVFFFCVSKISYQTSNQTCKFDKLSTKSQRIISS